MSDPNRFRGCHNVEEMSANMRNMLGFDCQVLKIAGDLSCGDTFSETAVANVIRNLREIAFDADNWLSEEQARDLDLQA